LISETVGLRRILFSKESDATIDHPSISRSTRSVGLRVDPLIRPILRPPVNLPDPSTGTLGLVRWPAKAAPQMSGLRKAAGPDQAATRQQNQTERGRRCREWWGSGAEKREFQDELAIVRPRQQVESQSQSAREKPRIEFCDFSHFPVNSEYS
jgi:hypothetical protein